MEDRIKPLNVKSLFATDFYSIPIYQRNYAWTSVEVNQLIQDVAAAALKNPINKYYIGNLIVDRHKAFFETIDGQQRITTLFIILCALKKLEVKGCESIPASINISFEHRKNSEKSLQRVFGGETGNLSDNDRMKDKYELHIIDIYASVLKDLPKICRNGLSIEKFADYLLNNVIILRIEVPEKIDKNHYFEVMNSRGIQLEQHEIIKAKMMSLLCNNSDRKTFDIIWEACSEMGRYCQMNFNVECRRAIFGDMWTQFPDMSFNKISQIFRRIKKDNDGYKISVRTLIDDFNEGNGEKYYVDYEDSVSKEVHFSSIINFPGLLLQVLKICRPENNIPLYDKLLVKTFNDVIEKEQNKSKFSMEFCICLLKCRYLLDTYIIKRNKEDEWGIFEMRTSKTKNSLHAYSVFTFGEYDGYGMNDELLMLQSMFHFSSPALNYKNWLNGILAYLYRTMDSYGNIDYSDYVNYLRNLAKAFMLDWYLTDDRIDFMTIIHENNGQSVHTADDLTDEDIKKYINIGTDVDAFVFNYYDYLIWKERNGTIPFKFTYRTSVEHFYPQHPTGGVVMAQDGPFLNSFGNLCLISTSMNSKFTNRLPAAKYAEYGASEKIRGLSIKLQEMFNTVEYNKARKDLKEVWFEDDIIKAEKKAISRLMKYLNQ